MKQFVVLATLLAFAQPASAQGTYLVRDINPGSNSSMPENFVAAGDYLYFDADHVEGNTMLQNSFFRTDGTEAGTVLIAPSFSRLPAAQWNANSSLAPRINAVDYDGRLAFVRAIDNGEELWVSDGTPEGTYQAFRTEHAIHSITPYEGALYFTVNAPDTSAIGGYRWDGEGEAVRIAGKNGLKYHTHRFLVGGGSLFFNDGQRIYDVSGGTPVALYDHDVVSTQHALDEMLFHNGMIIFKTKGFCYDCGVAEMRALDPVTKQHRQIIAFVGFPSGQVAQMGGSVYFPWVRHDRKLTNAVDTLVVYKISPSLDISELIAIPGPVDKTPTVNFFAANDEMVVFEYTAGDGHANLWRSDGSEAGTFPLLTAADSVWLFNAYVGNARLFFIGQERTSTWPNTEHGSELWTSDFTREGTQMAFDLNPGTQSGVSSDPYAPALASLDGVSVFFRGQQRDASGSGLGAELWRSDGSALTTTSAGNERTAPGAVVLNHARPNPFRSTTTIQYETASAGPVTLTVHDVTGRQVGTLVDGIQSAGSHTAAFDGSRLASGIYLYRLTAGGATVSGRVVLVK